MFKWGENMKLAIDAMSGDLGSRIVVDACLKFVEKHPNVKLLVTGKQEELTQLNNYSNVEIIDARDVVAMTDSVLGVRRKKESSLVKALMLSSDNKADGVVSCGSTGAYYTAAMLFGHRLENVEKSCLMAQLPTVNGKGTCLLDVGANASNTASQLESFAIMGSVYASAINHIEHPTVALLNIGTEDHKGDEVHTEAYRLLSANKNIHFIGNIEGRDLLLGEVDVIVTDGFSGNVALKSMEGTAIILMKLMKESLMSDFKGKIGALLAKKNLYSLKDRFDYKSVGGALMMGFDKAIVKAHGGSDAVAFLSAMELTYTMVKENVVEKMKEGMKNENS